MNWDLLTDSRKKNEIATNPAVNGIPRGCAFSLVRVCIQIMIMMKMMIKELLMMMMILIFWKYFGKGSMQVLIVCE